MTENDVNELLELLRDRLLQKPKGPILKEDAPVFPTKAQYPLKGLPFYVPPIYYTADFDEIDIYSPYSIYEVDDEHKRRRKALTTKSLYLCLELDTWEALKSETERTKSGYTSKTIRLMIDENKELREENQRLQKMIIDLIDKDLKCSA